MNENEYCLVYVDKVGEHSDGNIEYDFYFSKEPDTVWGIDWAEQCPSACANVEPEPNGIHAKLRVVCNIPLGVAQKNSCFSMQDCIDGIIALAWEDIREYSEYPEPYRIVMKFGETYERVAVKLESRGFELPSIEEEEPEMEEEDAGESGAPEDDMDF